MKKNVALLFGGESMEHQVSLRSARNIYDAIDKSKFNVIPIGISDTGNWYLFDDGDFLINENHPTSIRLNLEIFMNKKRKNDITILYDLVENNGIDAVFSVIHGSTGEDGKLQGYFELLGTPYVGPGLLSSAICMDKDVAKRILSSYGLEVSKWITIKRGEKITYDQASKSLGKELFVKPANEGSSVGVNMVDNKDDFNRAIKEAFKYDKKVLIEERVVGREIECSVLGNEDPVASIPGEVLSSSGFYSYEEKYISETAAKIEVPAKMKKDQINNIKEKAIDTYKALDCEGMARVDFFLTKDGRLIINEVNTIPGFTSISMFPKMWEASGIEYSDLITKLIELSFSKKTTS